MRHHNPLVTKPLQHGVVWKREVVRKIVVDLFCLSIQMHACMQLRAHAHARTRAHVRASKKASRELMLCARLDAPMHARLFACEVAKYLVVTL